MKILVLILFAAIVVSLGSGLFHLTKGEQHSPQMLKALKFRVALSIVLVIFLVAAYWLGYIQ